MYVCTSFLSIALANVAVELFETDIDFPSEDGNVYVEAGTMEKVYKYFARLLLLINILSVWRNRKLSWCETSC